MTFPLNGYLCHLQGNEIVETRGEERSKEAKMTVQVRGMNW